jgi:poly(3-hydroxyalkanoate) synthetase
MGSVFNERPEMRHKLEENVANLLDDVARLLTFVEQLGQANVDSENFENVPEDLGHKVFSSVFRDDVLRPQRFDPALEREKQGRTGSA